MEENIISVSQLNVGVQSWVVRVVLVEKSFVRRNVNMGRHYQRYVFADQLVTIKFFIFCYSFHVL